MATYTMFYDSGHGWLKVSLSEIAKLGITNDITCYSYWRGEYAYLEEDCDAVVFVNKKRELRQDVKIIEKHTSRKSKIRSYDSFRNKNWFV